jgi:hypothetical protein
MSRIYGVLAPILIDGGFDVPDEKDEKNRQTPFFINTLHGPVQVIEKFTIQELKNMMRYVKDFQPYDENYNTYVKILKEIGVTIKKLNDPEYIKEIIDVISYGYSTALYCVKKNDTYEWKSDDRSSDLILPGTTITSTGSEISTDNHPTIERMYNLTDIPPIYYHGRQDVKYLNPTFRSGGRKRTRKRKTHSRKK